MTTAAQALWQYGLSASAPLLVASQGHFLQSTIGIVPLSTTIWSPAAIIHELTFTCAAILLACWMMPKMVRPISSFPESLALSKTSAPWVADGQGTSPPSVSRSAWNEARSCRWRSRHHACGLAV